MPYYLVVLFEALFRKHLLRTLWVLGQNRWITYEICPSTCFCRAAWEEPSLTGQHDPRN